MSETDLSNKDRILHHLKSEALTSKEIAEKLGLNKQDTRTYLLRLKKEDKIKTLGKKERFYIYTYKKPFETEKSHAYTNALAEVLKEYVEFEPSFKNEINKKIADLEAKINNITSKPTKFREEEESFELQKELEMFELPSRQKSVPSSSQILEHSFIQLDGTLQTLLTTLPEIRAATIVSSEGTPIASALAQGVDEIRIANILASLFSLAERAFVEMKQGEFEQLYLKGSDGYLLVLAAGPNAVLCLSTTKDVRLGLIFLDCKRTCEKIAKLI